MINILNKINPQMLPQLQQTAGKGNSTQPDGQG